MSPDASRPCLRIGRDRIECADDLSGAAARFQSDRRLLIPRLVDADLLGLLQARLAHAPFTLRVATKVYPPATDLKLADAGITGLLHFLFNDAPVVQAIRAITGAPVNGFVGAAYRLIPGSGHRDSWHDDADGNRRVGLTLNLSTAPFEGGELQLRRAGSSDVLWTVANTGPGDGLLFPIDVSLQHCIRPMTGQAAKTALAGWFCVNPDRP